MCCAEFGCKTINKARANSVGDRWTILLLQHSISALPTISMPITARSAAPVGLVTSVHLTETCEKDSPHVITHVETTSAPVSDDARTATIHQGLKHKDLLPEQHIVDTGYVDAKL